jgi:hypothetical protein
VNVSVDDDDRLRLLAARTGRGVDDCLAEAVALLLERYRDHLPEQLSWPAAQPAGRDR